MTTWYLKKANDRVFGPVEESDLQQWAADARIAPEDRISSDQEIWIEPQELASLEMDWFVILEDDSSYGPLHAMALRDLYQDGMIQADTVVKHRFSGEQQPAYALMLRHVLDQNDQLMEHARELYSRNIALEEDARTRAEQPPVDESHPVAAHALKDAQKWKKLYEDEHRQRTELEEKFEQENRTLRDQLFEAQSARDKLAHRMHAFQTGSDGNDDERFQTLVVSYESLSESYDALLRQLHEKTEALNQAQEHRAESERLADERVKQLENRLTREREECVKARRQLAELETTHLQLVRSYREMNDRYIRSRQQTGSGATAPSTTAPKDKPKQAAPAKPTPASLPDNAPSSSKPEWKPKVRLT
jgi:DNA repair exonuclease SbcCD ATPase subunit